MTLFKGYELFEEVLEEYAMSTESTISDVEELIYQDDNVFEVVEMMYEDKMDSEYNVEVNDV